MAVKCEELKVERYLHIKRDGLLTLVLAGGRSVYLPIPAEIRNKFRRLYHIDLTQRGSVEMRCELIDEAQGEDIENGNFDAKLVYTIKKPKEDDARAQL